MKQKFSSLDIAAICAELEQRLVGLRLQNVYDVSSKLYLLKFAKPDVKELLLIESGIRIHLTDFMRDKPGLPSGFCMKIRKHLRTKRLTSVKQLGVDRIVDFQFGQNENAYHLLCEFYASGNIVLTDAQYNILSLLRVVAPEENVRFAVNERYPTQIAKLYSPISMDKIMECLNSASNKDNLKKAFSYKLDHSPQMVEHALLCSGIDASQKCSAFKSSGDNSWDQKKCQELLDALQLCDSLYQDIVKSPQGGIIVMQKISTSPSDQSAVLEKAEDGSLLAYHEFHPFKFKQFESNPVKEFPSYNKTVDNFFSASESQKLELKQRAQEELTKKKLEAVRKEHNSRVQGLAAALISNERKAQLIELNLEKVDQAIMIIRSAIAAAMDWTALKELVEEEQENGNPLALMIVRLKMETNQITLRLSEPDYQNEFGFSDDSDSDVDDEGNPKNSSNEVDVDIGLTAYANARMYYDMKKTSARKQEKTIQASNKAMKSAEAKIRREMEEVKVSVSINKIRKPFWFEKFIWFISNENYLVLGGRDAQQNEYLVKRHLKKGDLYIHADIAGSSSVIIKNPSGEPVPPMTLSQAGCMAICNSRAWDAKVVTSAYYVYHDQVSKTAPTGEFLTTGSFMIRGKKNYLPPTQLVYGFGLMFRVAEECIPNHLHERRPHLRGSVEGSEESIDAGASEVKPEEPISTAADDVEEGGELNTIESIEAKLRAAAVSDSDSSSSSSSSEDEDNDEPQPKEQMTLPEKYQFEEPLESSVSESLSSILNPEKPEKSSHKYISAKERRKLKKGEPQGNASPANSKDNMSSPAKSEKSDASKKQPPQVPRGKKGKLKKMKEKYGDQDEEERQVRMELLAADGNVKSQKKSRKQKQSEPVKISKEKRQPPAVTKVTQDQVQPEPKERDDEQPVQSEPVEDAQAEEQDDDVSSASDGDEDKEEVKRLMEEENIPNTDVQDDLEDLSYMDSITGCPLAEDILLFAIPVCAPYDSLKTFKYKVKLIPGGLKKGKAAKSAIANFLNKSDVSPVEKELIRNVPDGELIQAMLAKVKIVAPGIEQTKKKQKNAKRK